MNALVAVVLYLVSHFLVGFQDPNTAPWDIPTGIQFPECVVEDGSEGPMPCRWDAGDSGNGEGVSFTILPGNNNSRWLVYDSGEIVRL